MSHHFKKTESIVLFRDLIIKIDRPLEIRYRDSTICNRAYEKLKNIHVEDSWTEDADELFKKYDIKYKISTIDEFNEFKKQAIQIIYRK